MTATEAAPPVPKLEFAPVVQGVFGVLKRNLATFVGLAGILQGLPLLILVFGAMAAGSGAPLAAGSMSLGGLLWGVIVGVLVSLGVAVVQQ